MYKGGNVNYIYKNDKYIRCFGFFNLYLNLKRYI